MAIWIEIHCDALSDRCMTNQNENPAEMARIASAVPGVIKLIAEDAIRRGWVRWADGTWTCPRCRK